MSSEVASLVAHRVLLPDAPAPRDAGHEDVMERIPVEIWREILLICIVCPLLLQHDGDQYHDIVIREINCCLVAEYKQSERIRTRLRLVCQSWNQFLDEHSDRLVHLTSRVQSGCWPPVKRWDRVVRIEGSAYKCCYCVESCWPPALHGDEWPSRPFPTERRTSRDHLSQLSERCKTIILPGVWRNELVEQPGLRSVTMLKEIFYGRHNVGSQMSVLSKAYRKLTYLEISLTTINDPSIGLTLPFLTTLRLTIQHSPAPKAVNAAVAGAIGTWTLPNINFIHFDMPCASQGEIDAFNLFIGQVGRTLSTLIVRNYPRGDREVSTSLFAANIWSSLPALTCLGMDPTDLLYIPRPPQNSGGHLINLRLDTTGILDILGRLENLIRVFPTRWSSSTLGTVTFDMLWEKVVVMAPSGLALFDVLHRTGKGLVDSAGIPFDSAIRASLLQPRFASKFI